MLVFSLLFSVGALAAFATTRAPTCSFERSIGWYGAQAETQFVQSVAFRIVMHLQRGWPHLLRPLNFLPPALFATQLPPVAGCFVKVKLAQGFRSGSAIEQNLWASFTLTKHPATGGSRAAKRQAEGKSRAGAAGAAHLVASNKT